MHVASLPVKLSRDRITMSISKCHETKPAFLVTIVANPERGASPVFAERRTSPDDNTVKTKLVSVIQSKKEGKDQESIH